MSDSKIKMLGIDIGGGSGRGLIGTFDGEFIKIKEHKIRKISGRHKIGRANV